MAAPSLLHLLPICQNIIRIVQFRSQLLTRNLSNGVEHFTGFGHFNMLLGFSYLGKLYFGKLSLTHMYLLLTMWWHLMLLHICTWSSMWVAFARFQEGDVLVLKESVCFSSSSREKGSVRTIGDPSDCSFLSKWGSFQERSLLKHHRIKQRCEFQFQREQRRHYFLRQVV